MGEKLEVSFCLVKAREWKREFVELGKFLCLQFCVFCRKMTGCRLGCFSSSVSEQFHLCCCWVLHPRKPRARLCSWHKLIRLDRQRSDAEEVGRVAIITAQQDSRCMNAFRLLLGTSSATSLLELNAEKDLKEDRSVVLYPWPVWVP